MNFPSRVLIVAMAAAALVGCSDDDDDQVFATEPAALRVVHASPDAPLVNVLVDGTAALSDVDYKEGSGFTSLDAGVYDIAVEAITPAGNAAVIELADTALAAGTDYSVLAIGKVADSTLTALVLDKPTAAIPTGQVRAQVVHAAPDAPEVDVFVTAPGAALDGATALATLAFGENAGPVEIPAGDYQVRIATPGAGATVVFDSGTLSLPAGADLLIAAVNNTATGASPVSLVVNTGEAQFEVLDAATPAALRVGHLSADAPAVDVVVNDDFGAPAVSDLVFPTVTGYLALPPDDYNFKVVDSATQSLTAIDLAASLDAGVRYSVLAVNDLANIEPLVLTDEPRSIATEARVRIVHASPTAGAVDIYVTAPGTDITSVLPAFANVPFKGETGYVPLAPGSYDIRVTPAGVPSVVAIAVDALPLAGGDVLTAIARDNAGGAAPLGLVVIDETL
jgi:predicted dinucleotide-utilizing enzyme